MPTPSPWPYFTMEELSCRHCGKMLMNADFMAKIVKLRQMFNSPMPINSGYRCPEYNEKIGGEGPSHEGRAVDVSCTGLEALRLLQCAIKLDLFTGIGIDQRMSVPKGGHYIHFDDMQPNEVALPSARPWLWTYP